MKICIVGKFPPIQGGVSMLTYRYAHALARQGHEVHVVTNAGEVRPPYRMFMRDEDWERCEADYGGGFVRVHWTAPFGRDQWHIPTSNPFISKLTSVGAQVCADHDIDVVFSFYMEPYGVAGHLIAEIAGLPHVVKTAGSDAGRLWEHPQFQPLYNHVFKSADFIVAASKVFENLREIGVPSSHFRPDRDLRVPEDLFCPDGPTLDIERLCREIAASPDHAPLQWGRMREGVPYIGVYGKLGNSKGTFALLHALARLIESGRDIGLVVMGHEPPKSPVRFRDAVASLSLEDHVVQLPFLPHWRVPEFIRRCVAVCCLEQDFPIAIHTPIVPREVLCCGAPLIASTEMIGKLLQSDRLVDGYNCYAVKDVNDIDDLAAKILRAVDAGDQRATIGRRAREYVLDVQKSLRFPQRLERTLALAVSGQSEQAQDPHAAPSGGRFSLTRLVARVAEIEHDWDLGDAPAEPVAEMAWAEGVLSTLSSHVDTGAGSLAPLRDAVKFDLCMARAALAKRRDAANDRLADRLFRLDLRNGGAYPADIRHLRPWRLPHVAADRFDHDVNSFLSAQAAKAFPAAVPARETYAVVLADPKVRGIRTIVLDAAAGRLLEFCDGCSTVAELGAKMAAVMPGRKFDDAWVRATVERFFEIGLIGLTDNRPAAAVA